MGVSWLTAGILTGGLVVAGTMVAAGVTVGSVGGEKNIPRAVFSVPRLPPFLSRYDWARSDLFQPSKLRECRGTAVSDVKGETRMLAYPVLGVDDRGVCSSHVLLDIDFLFLRLRVSSGTRLSSVSKHSNANVIPSS